MGEKIIGMGLDMVEVKRIRSSIKKLGEKFLDRVYLPGEIQYASSHKNSAIYFAARFAAKEAVSKAFGTGIGEYISWLDIEVCRHPHGEPYIKFHGKGEKLAKKRKVNRCLISLTHTDKDHAAASAILISV
jgi:holo-[acyl-carrier protein] synthase